jgi:NCAIR mutase (PurE)-related protein
MDASSLKSMLQALWNRTLTPDEVEHKLRWHAPFENLEGVATVDLHRRVRCGFPEVIFGQGKTPDHIVRIIHVLRDRGESVLATRLAPEAATRLQQEFPDGHYNALGRTFQLAPSVDPGPKIGKVVVVTAGTSDLPVAEEAKVTAEAWNCNVELVADVGVAGIHRLFHRLSSMQGADAIVVVAGMEGALPSVVGGLVDCPVIAVPTSIGYGASFGGIAALLGMLNSCSSNIAVVNIDAGFNGGHFAALIARRAGLARLQRPEDTLSPEVESGS